MLCFEIIKNNLIKKEKVTVLINIFAAMLVDCDQEYGACL